MENIYIILSATPTIMGKLIRTLTKEPFNHSSISLSENWSEMYSYARYNVSNPLVGGFIREYPQRLSLGKDKKVYIEVYEIQVSKEQYEKIKTFIYNIRDDKEKYIYNSIAAVGLLFGSKFNAYKADICSNFVVKSLLYGDIIQNIDTQKIISPSEIRNMISEYLNFSGYLNNYIPIMGESYELCDFFNKTNIIIELKKTFSHFYTLFKRYMQNYLNYTYDKKRKILLKNHISSSDNKHIAKE